MDILIYLAGNVFFWLAMLFWAGILAFKTLFWLSDRAVDRIARASRDRHVEVDR